jgi:hypothetical protein
VQCIPRLFPGATRARTGSGWIKIPARAWSGSGRIPRSTLNLDSTPVAANAAAQQPAALSLMQHRTRAIWILVFLACGFTAISFNLIQIQLVDHDKYLRLAVENHTHPEVDSPGGAPSSTATAIFLAQTQRVYDIRLDGQLMNARSSRNQSSEDRGGAPGAGGAFRPCV